MVPEVLRALAAPLVLFPRKMQLVIMDGIVLSVFNAGESVTVLPVNRQFVAIVFP